MPRANKKSSPTKDGEYGTEKEKIKRKRLESYQVTSLEAHFARDIYPSTQTKDEIAKQLNMGAGAVTKWFINRRVKLRHEEKNDEDSGGGKKEKKKDKEPASANGSPIGTPISVSTPIEASASTIKITLRGKDEEKASPMELPKSVESKSKDNGTMLITLGPTASPAPVPLVSSTPTKRKERKEEKEKPSLKEKPVVEKRKEKEKTPKILYTPEEEEQFWDSYRLTNNIREQVDEDGLDGLTIAMDELVEEEDDSNEFDADGEDDEARYAKRQRITKPSLPIWKQLYSKYKEKLEKKKNNEVQEILNHIYRTRKRQGLSPFFAMLTGPTIRPHRMEELELVLGRNTPRHKEADLHVGDSPKISHIHCRIEFDRIEQCFYLVNLAKNGVKLKEGDIWVEYRDVYDRIPLPNPTAFDIQGTIVYFQIFYISTPSREFDFDVYDEDSKTRDSTPVSTRTRKAASKGMKSYAGMIEEALRAYDGQATYKEITDYISTRCQEDIMLRKTWRNSVGGVLSSHPLFEAVPTTEDVVKDPKRGRGGFWRLKYHVREKDSKPSPSSSVHITIPGLGPPPSTSPDISRNPSSTKMSISTIVEPPAEYPLAFDLKPEEEIDVGEEADNLPTRTASSMSRDDLELDEDDDDSFFFEPK